MSTKPKSVALPYPGERVAEAEKRRLEQMVERFQSEPDPAKAHQQWKQIEKLLFGVEFPD